MCDVNVRAHDIPPLDTREYEIKWDDGGLSAATANVIAELMYNMCDGGLNRMLLFDTMVAHRRCLIANTHTDQKFTDQYGKVLTVHTPHGRLTTVCPVEGRFDFMGETLHFQGMSSCTD